MDAGQVVGGVEPGQDDGVLEVKGPVAQLPLDVAGQSGVPAQLQGAEQGELVAEGLGRAIPVTTLRP